MVTICPSFGLHELGAEACGAHVSEVPFAPDWSFPLDGLARAMAAEAPRVLIFSSSSNPAGPAIIPAEFDALLKATPADTLVVFDEVCLEYLDADRRFDALRQLAATPHPLIVLRTFSKAYGLAGGLWTSLRDRPGGADDESAQSLRPNALAVAAASAALRGSNRLTHSVAQAAQVRARMAAALPQAGFTCAPSHTNLVSFHARKKATEFAEALRHKAVLI